MEENLKKYRKCAKKGKLQNTRSATKKLQDSENVAIQIQMKIVKF